MINREVKNTLYQFKRIHNKQLKPHEQLLPAELELQIKRKNLREMSNIDLKKLARSVLRTIKDYQSSREKPHAGLMQFQQTLKNLIS